jgi:hypothetical protein
MTLHFLDVLSVPDKWQEVPANKLSWLAETHVGSGKLVCKIPFKPTTLRRIVVMRHPRAADLSYSERQLSPIFKVGTPALQGCRRGPAPVRLPPGPLCSVLQPAGQGSRSRSAARHRGAPESTGKRGCRH